MKIRTATLADLPVLMELMRGYYRDDGLEFDPDQSVAVMTRLLCETHWGRVLLGENDGVAIGYLAVCLGFSLELRGHDAFIDEVFVLPEHRRRGYGRMLLESAGKLARELGVVALHLEVDRANTGAQQLYDSLGYRRRERYFLMTLEP